MVERHAERFGRDDHKLAALRHSQWGARTQGDPYAKLRRRRKRLTDQVRPREPDTGEDPWRLAAAAISALTHMRQKDPAVIAAAVEALRRLA